MTLSDDDDVDDDAVIQNDLSQIHYNYALTCDCACVMVNDDFESGLIQND